MRIKYAAICFMVSVVAIFSTLILSVDSTSVRYDEDGGYVHVLGKDDKIYDYLKGEFYTTDVKNTYDASVSGIENMLDDQRKQIKKLLGNEMYKNYLKTGAITVLDVEDVGNKIVVYVQTGNGFMYDGKQGVGQLRDRQDVLAGLAYTYGKNRDIVVKFGYMKMNKYNKPEFEPDTSEVTNNYDEIDNFLGETEFLFKSSEIRKIETWDGYSYEQLMELNEYKQKK